MLGGVLNVDQWFSTLGCWRPTKQNKTLFGEPYSTKMLLCTGYGDPNVGRKPHVEKHCFRWCCIFFSLFGRTKCFSKLLCYPILPNIPTTILTVIFSPSYLQFAPDLWAQFASDYLLINCRWFFFLLVWNTVLLRIVCFEEKKEDFRTKKDLCKQMKASRSCC